MKIREGRLSDVEEMVRLSEAFRESLAAYSPTFWRKAEDSFERQAAFFRALIPLEDTFVLVAEDKSEMVGFIIGRLQEAPPVYAPGGPVCLIDDFCVASDAEWSTVGSPLLAEVEQWARRQGAVLSVVICPERGDAKRGFLAEERFEPTSGWHVRDL